MNPKKVLADDQNHDRIRSLLRVFGPARVFLAEYESQLAMVNKQW